MGNNRGAAFRLGVREEAGCWQGKRGGKPGGPLLHIPPLPPGVLGAGGLCREIQNGGGEDATPLHSTHPPGALHLLRFLV